MTSKNNYITIYLSGRNGVSLFFQVDCNLRAVCKYGFLNFPVVRIKAVGYKLAFRNPAVEIGYDLTACNQFRHMSFILGECAVRIGVSTIAEQVRSAAVNESIQHMVSSLAAWVMVRSKSILGTVLYLGFTAAMLIPFQSLMYPLLDLFEKIGLKNIPGLIFMYGGFGLSMSVFLYHGFIKSVPQSLEEAAIIDGANIFQMFFKVVFPLLKGTTVTVIVLNGMWIWNDYLLPFLVIGNSNGVKTLTLELYFAKLTSGQYGNPWELIFPAVLVTIIPIVILYIFLQKYIVAGVAEGAVKM